MALMVSISGIRGVVGETLTPETIVKYASAYSEFCNRGHIIVGRDGRVTGKNILDIVVSTLRQMGCNVTDLGICPTPTVALAVEKLKSTGGISITASHNPMMWNGLKFFAPTGLFLDADENLKFWHLAEHSAKYVPWDKQGTYELNEAFLDEHICQVLSLAYIDTGKIRARKFKVVLDCVNSAGGIIVPRLLEKLGCEVTPLYCEVTGIFGHTPEPIPENLTALCAKVREVKADIGIAVDPDVDRLVLINEKGEPFVEEYTIATCINFVLKKEKLNNLKVVVNLSTTRAVDDIVNRYGGTTYRTAVGEINVAKRMKEVGAIIGGEGSGGVILPKVHLGRDAIVGIGLVLQSLLEFGGTMSELKATLPQYLITKGKIELGSLNADAIMKRLQEKFSSTGVMNTDDGLKIDFPDAWVHLRKSNTEPIIRIIAEAHTKAEADEFVKKFTEEILAK
ncbi:MAG: phosphoglucosamine mutase [Ignavibacteriales bacterium]|nr:phosphoglucosamine mutase [Ignavibacteriales bacterium]